MSTLVVFCHPVPESFVSAVSARVVETLHAAGADPHLLDLYADGFSAGAAAADLVAAHQEALRRARGLVLVYPTWWSGLPAMLGGWFEQVVAGGFAPRTGSRAASSAATREARERLANLQFVAVATTHGSSKLVNGIQGEAGLHFLRRCLRPLCPRHCRRRFRWIAFYSSDTSTAADREKYLNRVEHQLARLALGG